MNPIFPVGIHSLWDELNHMPTGGVWWINTDRDDDAYRLANQTITAQQVEARVAVVTQGIAPREVIHAPVHGGPDKIRLFSGRNTPDSLDFFTRDLMSSIDPRHFLILVITPTNYWQNISSAQIHNWLKKTSSWTKENNCTVMIINPGNNSDKQYSMLISEHRYLDGLASLRCQGDEHLFDVAYWCNEKGVSAQQQVQLAASTTAGWSVVPKEESAPQPRSDEKQVLSHVAVLEGAPPLSENWLLFDNNEMLFSEARAAQAATIIFSLAQNNQIEGLARHIHTLRRQRGTALKIIVRENQASLRATDERLLLGCGATMIIPWNAPLSRCLTLIESVQGQMFSRHVPEDINLLLDAMQPLKLRGYQPWQGFCQAVGALMSNPLLPLDGKGVMVALRPVPGIRAEQALTLCRPVRMGDIVTLGDGRLVLFLSFCRINDLDTALNHIFPLPVGDIFSNRKVWFEDSQIAAELVQMRNMNPEKWGKPLAGPGDISAVIRAQHDGHAWRRIPEPVTLLDGSNGGTSA
ncbi:cellulose biosynthesis protein BcsE [Siccibacter colletis]|uniref:Cellulose biosynthesis protein BcsE n=1 Tax=Siccibacter colletis TaxID=1505757 RepID=A0ABY6JE43_9ENTR|nr:cellulose biosynthesis protein BcsE [Siccibacter colletis]UYU32096.1 cellulose biosynthesis protein BcsE [Siccibacter colletis]